ncbi:hypothetical protein [Thioclava sp.]|uniref:hypothetical protein n=1 Tax=Thioclava sp. TaxID=1933450 RepID=UPI003AA8525B
MTRRTDPRPSLCGVPILLDAQIARCLDLDISAVSYFWDVVPQAVARLRRMALEASEHLTGIGTLNPSAAGEP